MTTRKCPVDKLVNWPHIPGDYVIGSRMSPVAVMVVGTSEKIRDEERAIIQKAIESGAAIAGICKTANIGLERVIANIIANPNIRYLIITGLEDNAHKCALAMLMLWRYGVDPKTRAIKCGLDKPCVDEIPEAFIPNLPLEAIERFRKQVKIIPAIAKYDDLPPKAFLAEVAVGSRKFTIPVKSYVAHEFSSRQVEVSELIVTRKHLPEIIAFLVHSSLQEPENKVVLRRVDSLYADLLDEEEIALFDPGAYEEEPMVINLEIGIRAESKPTVTVTIPQQTVTEVKPLVSPSSQTMYVDELGQSLVFLPLMIPVPKQLVEETAAKLDSIVIDLGWIVIGRFKRFKDGYETLKKVILEKGVDRPTRHGNTKEINAIVIYEQLPEFKFKEENGRIDIEDFDFSDVELSSFPIRSREYFKNYCEDLLNGVWKNPGWEKGQYHYSYGAQLRKYGYDICIFLPKLASELGLSAEEVEMIRELYCEGGKLVVDQLGELIRNMLKMPFERCFCVTFWQPILDTACRRAQVCFVILDFKNVPYPNGEVRLETTCLMRSHDFLNAHIENAYGLAAIINYLAWKLRQLASVELEKVREEIRKLETASQLDEEARKKLADLKRRERELEALTRLKIGRLVWIITSCHIYKHHVGLK